MSAKQVKQKTEKTKKHTAAKPLKPAPKNGKPDVQASPQVATILQMQQQQGNAHVQRWLGLDKLTSFLSTVLGELKRGSEGTAVQNLQQALLKAGYALGKYGADGKFGRLTARAVRRFQRDHGLPETGVADLRTQFTLYQSQPTAADASAKSDGKDETQAPGGREPVPAAPETPASSPGKVDKPTSLPGPISSPAPATTDLQDKGLAAFVSSLNNAAATSAAQDLANLEKKYKEVARRNTEEKGPGRDELVAGIAQLRQKIEALDNAGINPVHLAELKKRLYRGINDVSPFYAQSRNMDLLEGKEQAKELGTSTSVSTRTCNITSLSMALESLGKSAADYDNGKRDEILAAAKVFAAEVRSAELKVGGEGTTWSALEGLRLSDFVQLAAIAELLSGGNAANATIIAAAKKAWKKILSIYFLKDLAERFGADAAVKLFTLDPSKTRKEQRKEAYALKGWSGKYRRSVERLVDDRNKMEATTGKEHEKYKKRYEKRLNSLDKAMTGAGIEKKIALEAYKTAVTGQVGKELDAGSAVVVALSGHYVRLQAIHDDHVIVDDPGSQGRANRKVTWAEARAMGYFAFRLVIK